MQGFKKVVSNKKAKRATKKIIEVNYSISQFCNGLLIKYDHVLEDEEKQSLKNIEQHMINLSAELVKNI